MNTSVSLSVVLEIFFSRDIKANTGRKFLKYFILVGKHPVSLMFFVVGCPKYTV